MAFPYFRLRVDDWADYHVHCSSTFGKQQASTFDASELEFYNNSINSYGITQRKALTSSKLFNFVVQRLEGSEEKTFSREEISMILRDGMAMHCFTAFKDRESLVQ